MIGLDFLLTWILVGFLAQFINGSLGMAYGVTSTAFLVSLGVYPIVASTSVRTARIFTTLVSGGAHLKVGNVRHDIVLSLLTFGVLGGVAGAYFCTIISANLLRALVGSVLLVMGLLILLKFMLKRKLRFKKDKPSTTRLRVVGFIAAFLDALASGGWGPIATIILVTDDFEPSKAIGSVNFAKFFITLFEALTFFVLLGPENFYLENILGLIVGGLICTPLAILVSRKIPQRILGILVGVTVITLSVHMLFIFSGLL